MPSRQRDLTTPASASAASVAFGVRLAQAVRFERERPTSDAASSRSALGSRCTSTPTSGTRSEYRALLDKYALSHFPAQTKLTEITPRHIASFVGWLCEQTKRSATWEDPDRRVPLSDKTVRNALGPLKACLATARREGLIRHNPATDVALPHRARVDDDDDRPRPFPRIKGDDGEPIETMELVVEHVHESHRLMFELLAATGLRRSELLVLEGHHLALDGDRPHVKVRQRVRRRRGEVL
jgi:integrase